MSKRLKMAEISAIQALLQRGWSQRWIARELGVACEGATKRCRRARLRQPLELAAECLHFWRAVQAEQPAEVVR
jgi:IS30 family transposase